MVGVDTSRVAGAVLGRIGFPPSEEKCDVCNQFRKGVTAPWGETRSCVSDACLLVAQTQDCGVRRASGTTITAPKTPAKGQFFAGCGVAYTGNETWAVCFLDKDDPTVQTWFKDISLAQVHDLIDDHCKRFVRQETH